VTSARAAVLNLKSWVIQTALPRWHATGWDEKAGGFVEEWHANGEPNPEAIRRLRVQARQIYSFAHAAALGWYPQGLPLALNGFKWMMTKGWSPDGRPGFIHKLNPDGSTADPRRDSYDHMFVLLALSWLWKASADERVREAFEQTLAYVDNALMDGGGTLYEGEPRSLPRRQNPNMHAFEAKLAMHETGIRTDALQRADAYLARFHTTFFDTKNKLVLEDFGADWERLPPPAGDKVEPGHGAEWVWLLRRHGLISQKPAGSIPAALFAQTRTMALPVSGLLPDECSADGTVRRATSRIWTMTEYVKAAVMEAEAGDASARQLAVTLIEQLNKTYLAPAPAGGWIDQIDATGHPIKGPIPASILYHLLAAAVEADRVFGSQDQGS
jgi:mannose/cellobiose epimerase-like protein (N-acyl-D-glucosamine 2-epimerase family)